MIVCCVIALGERSYRRITLPFRRPLRPSVDRADKARQAQHSYNKNR